MQQQQPPQGDRQRGDHNQMGGHGQGQMLQGGSQQGMMWEPQSGFQQQQQQQWELPRASQQQGQKAAGRTPENAPSWNTAAAEFTPQSLRSTGGTPAPFDANARPFQPANAKAFEKS